MAQAKTPGNTLSQDGRKPKALHSEIHTWGFFSSYWVTLFNLNMRAFALCYCILFSPVWLSSLGGLFFSEEETDGELIWERKTWGLAGRSGEKGSHSWGVMYDRRVYANKNF